MRMSTMSGVQEENTEFWARQFAGRWYRGAAQVENDFRRFAIAYRVPPRMRARVMARALGLVGDRLRAA
jgi:hypothetical protein